MKTFRNFLLACGGVLTFIVGIGLLVIAIVASVDQKHLDWPDLVGGLFTLGVSIGLLSFYKRSAGKSWMDIIGTLFDLLTSGL